MIPSAEKDSDGNDSTFIILIFLTCSVDSFGLSTHRPPPPTVVVVNFIGIAAAAKSHQSCLTLCDP